MFEVGRGSLKWGGGFGGGGVGGYLSNGVFWGLIECMSMGGELFDLVIFLLLLDIDLYEIW